MSKLPVSVCIIAKNEEKYIEECLKRLKPYGFEILVTDTGSIDRTKEIAAKYADKVLDFEWINDFSAARNFCAEHASNNWILALDCDEYVNSLDVNSLRILMQKCPHMAGGLRITNIVSKENGEKGFTIDDVTRMYNKKFYTFVEPIHEQICTIDESKRNDALQCFLLPMEVIHHGYDLSPEEMAKKQKRNLEILYKELEKNPDDPYIMFQIGQSESIINNTEKSIEMYEGALAQNPHTDGVYVQIAIESLAKNYCRMGRHEDALKLMEHYSQDCKTAKFVYTYACVFLDSGQKLKALLYFVKATMMSDFDTLGEAHLKCYEYVIRLYLEMGNTEMAEVFREKYEACLKEKERVMNS